MKPIYLEFCGINSFSEKTKIDFKSLLSGGVFGIFGDTGSGKSTILDCIHLALYGVVERASKSMVDCINYNADGAYVLFDFEITTDGVRHTYRVRRERKRKNNTSKAFLYEFESADTLIAIAEGTRDVDDAIERIIGLNFNDFKMCIALPQGDFAALVKAGTAERVKLVSRLFDLEKYGEKLSKAANEKFYKVEQEVNLLKAEMGQNEGGRDEVISEKRLEVEYEKQALGTLKKQLELAEKELEKQSLLAKEKLEYDGLCKNIQTLERRLPEMEEKRKQIGRLAGATLIVERAKELENNEKECLTAKEKLTQATESLEKARLLSKEAKRLLEEGEFDKKIVDISLLLERANNAQADLQTAREAKQKLDECIEEYKRLSKVSPKEDFDGLRAKLEKEIADLGEDESLLSYIEHHFKDALLSEERREVQGDLISLREKYPQAEKDLTVLIEKYAVKGEPQEGVDVEVLQAQFKKIEGRRKTLKGELEGLVKRQQSYELNERQKELLTEQGKIYRESYLLAEKKIQSVKELPSPKELAASLQKTQTDKKLVQEKLEKAQQREQTFFTEAETQKKVIQLHEKMQSSLQNALEKSLKESEFVSVTEAKELLQRLGSEEEAKTECKTFFERYELLKSKWQEYDRTKFENFDGMAVERAKENKRALEEERDSKNRKIAAGETQIAQLEELKKRYQAFEKQLKEREKEKALCDELRTMLRSNRFLEFIAAEYLQEICLSASRTLLSLTSGRYFLRYEKEFKVGDNLDGGNVRAVKTLSGGETFLVSLSLALSLSGAICQKSLRPIEFFFLDEGFGTLDERLIDTVMDVLGKLSKNFAVGLISHVEELKHRIENKILVTGATETHGSSVRLEHF